MRVRFVLPIAPPLSTVFLALPLLAFAVQQSQAQAPNETRETSRVSTLAIFPDPKAPPMSDGIWQALITSIRGQLSSSASEMRSMAAPSLHDHKPGGPAAPASETSTEPATRPQLEILRGDRIAPGLVVDDSVTVYLRGDCGNTPARPSPFFALLPVSGALGWVNMVNGKIEPLIYIDCKLLSRLLGPLESTRSFQQRNELVARATARVIVHEWIHIATQSPHHSKHGITKAEFGVEDLVAEPSGPANLLANPWLTADRDSSARLTSAPHQSSGSRIWATR